MYACGSGNEGNVKLSETYIGKPFRFPTCNTGGFVISVVLLTTRSRK